jgi:hypothetical protein
LKRHRLTDNEILNIKQSINQAKMEPPSENSDESERPADRSDQHHSVEETTITVIDTSLSDMRSAMPGEALTLHGHIAEQWEKTKHTKLHERKVLKKVTGPKVSQVIDIANKALTLVIAEYPVTNLTDLNHLFYATATVVTNMISEDRPKEQTLSHKPRLTRAERIQARMDKQIAGWRKEVSWTSEILNERNTKNVQLKKRKLTRKYNLEIAQINETLKQKIAAKAQRKRRYQKREKFFKQNNLFKTDTKKFYRELNSDQNKVSHPPTKEALEHFWRPIWENPKTFQGEEKGWFESYNRSAQMIDTQELPPITGQEFAKAVSHAANWRAPGPDKLQNFWLKKLTALHSTMVSLFNQVVQSPCDSPTWLTEGVTYMLPKSAETANPKNYRPITCLPTTYKVLTSILSERIYHHAIENHILPEEQRGCRKNSYGTKDQLLLNKTILNDAKRHRKNLAVAWIDYKKAFDSLPHAWIVKCLELQKVNSLLIELLKHNMKNWKTSLTLNHNEGSIVVPDVKITSGIFQGDSLSPLLFCLALAPLSQILNNMDAGYYIGSGTTATKANHLLYMDDLKLYSKNERELTKLLEAVHSFSSDIGMSFGIEKCAKAEFSRGRFKTGKNIALGHDVAIRNLDQHEAYKYLGIDEGDGIHQEKMKAKIKSEYIRRTRLVLRSELNSQNQIQAINSLAVPVVSYSFGVIDWTKNELRKLDTKTRKLMTSQKSHHPKASVDRLYLKRSEGGRGLLQIEESHQLAIIGLSSYLRSQPNDSILAAVLKSDQKKGKRSLNSLADSYLQEVSVTIETTEDALLPTQAAKATKAQAKDALYNERYARQTRMNMYGQFQRHANEGHINKDLTFRWLKSAQLKPETESFLLAAQDQCLPTKYHKAKITKEINDSKCRMCGQADEHVMHILAGCPVLAPKEFLHRHDQVGKYIHWKICHHYNIPNTAENWYEHKPETVTTWEDITILWDMQIQTDRTIKANKPDIVIKDQTNSQCWLIDMAVPSDYNVAATKVEKLSKYKDLEIEIARMWRMKVRTVPVVIGALGSVQNGTNALISQIPADNLQIQQLQKIALLGSAHILRKFLSIQ